MEWVSKDKHSGKRPRLSKSARVPDASVVTLVWHTSQIMTPRKAKNAFKLLNNWKAERLEVWEDGSEVFTIVLPDSGLRMAKLLKSARLSGLAVYHGRKGRVMLASGRGDRAVVTRKAASRKRALDREVQGFVSHILPSKLLIRLFGSVAKAQKEMGKAVSVPTNPISSLPLDWSEPLKSDHWFRLCKKWDQWAVLWYRITQAMMNAAKRKSKSQKVCNWRYWYLSQFACMVSGIDRPARPKRYRVASFDETRPDSWEYRHNPVPRDARGYTD